MRRCPICRGAVAARDKNQGFPFCGERCRLIDLGQWLSEDYRVPDPTPPSSDSPPNDGSPEEGSQ